MKPILFNTEMVRAILEGRKTVTRRVVKPQPPATSVVRKRGCSWDWTFWADCDMGHLMLPPYHPGDILWVRETWAHPSAAEIAAGADPNMYLYRADVLQPAAWDKWRPSIHMPKEAARLFLRVTGVRVERLQEMVLADVLMEGILEADSYEGTWERWHKTWNNTVKPIDLPLYGWEANPWLWVIEFERISKEAAIGGGGDG